MDDEQMRRVSTLNVSAFKMRMHCLLSYSYFRLFLIFYFIIFHIIYYI